MTNSKTNHNHAHEKAFSLVELSIVLVILGLLASGILAGRSLIRAAEIRAISSEAASFATAVNLFKNKYFALPGDMTNATRFWGDNASLCSDGTIADGSPGTCDGDGNRIMGKPTAADATGEMYQFWHQLALAGMITGDFTGAAGSGGNVNSIVGENIPASRFPNGSWNVWETDASDGTSGSDYAINFGNHLMYGAPWPGNGFGEPVLYPEDVWNVDKKIDDGLPARGKIIARGWNDSCAFAVDGTHSATNFDAEYKLSDTSTLCAFRFMGIID